MPVTNDFTTSELDLNGFVNISSPTALVWGPDGRLYVTQQTGEVFVLDVAFGDNPNDPETTAGFYVTDAETVLDVQNVPNNNDDGTPSNGSVRQVTGIDVAQQFDASGAPVLIGGEPAVVMYVTSSDSRIGAGSNGGDTGLDTNSGVITKLTQTATGWDAVDIVRGLPRSEENHATNGLEVIQELDGSGNLVSERLIVASGGNANTGAPSNNFAGQQETPLAAALLEVDLDEINGLPVQNDNGRAYVYDLPTLDDPTRGAEEEGQDPFGGNDGINSAKVLGTGPVQIYSAGYRNAYDVEVTEDGRVFTYDNGANNGWGGRPAGEDQNGDNLSFNDGVGTPNGYIATNLFVEDNLERQADGSTANFNPQNWDQLHEATRSDDLGARDLSAGLGGAQTYQWDHPDLGELTLVYGGHPNPTRAEGARAGLLYTPNDGVEGAKLMVSNVEKIGGSSDYLEVVAWLQQTGYDDAFINETVVAVEPGVTYADAFASGFGVSARPTTTGVYSLVPDANGPIGLPSDIDDIVFALNPIEGDYLEAGFKDGALDTGKGSINGLAEYTSSIFEDNGQPGMQGALLAAVLNQQQLLVIGRETDGTVETTTTTEGNFNSTGNAGSTPRTVAADKDFIASGGAPLGLATLGDDLPQVAGQAAFQGTIWAGIFKQNGPVIEIYQPGNPDTNALLATGNYAGQDAVQDPTDQDGDGVDFINDPFEFDADNGLDITAGQQITLDFAQTDLNFPGTLGDTGLLGAALDGVTPNRDAQSAADGFPANQQEDGLFDNAGNLILGANGPFFQIKEVQDGTAIGSANTLRDAVHTGVNLADNVDSIFAEADIANWWSAQEGGGRVSGLNFGDGTQSNFVRVVWGDVNNNGTLGLEVGIETGDSYTVLASTTDAAFTSALTNDPNGNKRVTLQLGIEDIGGTYALQAAYKTSDNTDFTSIDLGGATLPAGVLQDVLDGTHTISDSDSTLSSGAAFGFMAEKNDGVAFEAVDYDELRINAFGDSADTILYRVNAGNETIAAIDGGPNWIADSTFEGATTGNIIFSGSSDGAVFGNELTDEASEVEFDNGALSADAAVAPAALFFEERTKGDNLSYDFAVQTGATYTITVYYTENFNNIFSNAPRIMDVEVEGAVPAVFDDLHPLRESVDVVDGPGAPIPAFGSGNLPEKNPYLGRALEREFTYTATDNTLTLNFAKGGDGTGNQPKVNAIQIVEIGGSGGSGPDITAPVIANITVEDSTSDTDSPRQVVVTVTDETGLDAATLNALTGAELTFSGLTPATVSAPAVSVAGNGLSATLTYSITPPANTGAWPAGNFSVAFAANSVADTAGNTSANTSFAFSFSGTGGTQPGEVVLAVNVGGTEVDGTAYGLPGVTFEEDTKTNPHPTVDFTQTTTGGATNFGNNTNNAGNGETFTGLNVPDDVFTSERFGNDFSYDVDLANGDYVVDLYFAETFFGTNGENAVGARVFDVEIEGETVLENFDLYDEGDGAAGNDAGAPLVKIVRSFDATVTDGVLTIRLDSIDEDDVNNAKLSAFVVRAAGTEQITPTDTVDGTAVINGDFSDNGLAPTNIGILAQGETTIVASQQGDDEPGGRERDYFTFTVAEGQELTGIILESWDTNEIGVPQAFVGIQQGDQVTVDPETFANVGDLLGGHVYSSGDVENPATGQAGNLLAPDALGKGFENGPGGTFNFGDGSGFEPPLPAGTYTLWLNQGGDVSTATLRLVTSPIGAPDAITIQAEDFTATDGFAAEAIGAADGGEVVSLPKYGFAGTATYDLSDDVAPGTYTVRVAYYDENDGESLIGLQITSNGEGDFKDVVRLNENTSSATATSGTLRIAEFENVEIGSNGQLELSGITIGSENARVDYFQFVPSSGANNGPAQVAAASSASTYDGSYAYDDDGDDYGPQFGPQFGPGDASASDVANAGPENAIRIQAESFDSSDTYAAQSVEGADGGAVIGLPKFGMAGTATYDLSGQVAPGIYTVRIVYYDENDGQSVMRMNIASSGADDYTQLVRFDDASGSGQAGANTQRQAEFVNVEIGSDGQLTLSGMSVGSEFARVDYFEFVPQDGLIDDTTPPSTNAAPSAVALTAAVTLLSEDTDTTNAIRIGDIAVTDDDEGTNNLSLTGPAADKFEIVDDALFLKAGAVLDFEDMPTLNVTIAADDPSVDTGGFDASTAFALELTDVNEAPSLGFGGDVLPIDEDTDTSAAVAIVPLAVTDDALGINTLTLTGANADLFEIADNTLFLKAGTSLDFESVDSYSVTVQVDDPEVGTGDFDGSVDVTLPVTDVNEAPSLSVNSLVGSLEEDADTTAAITVATITVDDDALGNNSLSLAGADADLFEISGNSLLLKAGTTLDAGANASLDVSILLDDPSLGDNAEDSTSLSIDVGSDSPVLLRINAFGDAISVAGPDWQEDTKDNPSPFYEAGQNRGDTDPTPATPGLAGVPNEIFATARSDNNEFAYDIPIGALPGVSVGDNVTVNLYYAEASDSGNFQNPEGRIFDVQIEGALAQDAFSPVGTFGAGNGGVVSTVVQITDGTLNIDFIDNGTSNALINGIEIVAGGENAINTGAGVPGASDALEILGVADGDFDGTVQGVAVDDSNDGGANGAVVLTVLDGNNRVDASNFNTNAFELQNSGDKEVAAVFIDIRDAVFKDHVFDNDGEGGDRAAKDFLVQGGIETTGAFFVGANDVAGNPDDNLFFAGDTPIADTSGVSGGAAISGGHRGLLIRFDGSADGFDNGEVVGFSGDGDPNSIAGFTPNQLKPNNVTDGEFDTGGQSGAELIGSSFTVLFADGTTATGYLGSDTTQAGAAGEAVQGRAARTVDVSVDTGAGTFTDGQEGTYGGDVPEITLTGTPGDVVRVTLLKGFRATNEEAGGSPDLVADVIQSRIDESHPEFGVNNAFDVQTVDIAIKPDGTATVPLGAFDYVNTTSGISFAGDDVQPLAITASVITEVTANGAISGSGESDFVPAGPLSAPIYLKNPTETPVDQSNVSTGPEEGYFEIVGTGENQYFKIQIEDENGTGGATPPGKWAFFDAAEVVEIETETGPQTVTRQDGFQGSGYYVFGDPTTTNIDNNIAQTELLEYTIFVPQDAIGVYNFSFRVSRDGQEAGDQQNDLWLSFKAAEDEGFGDIVPFLTEPDRSLDPENNIPEPENDGFVKIFGGPNTGAWGTTGNIDGDPDNFKAEIEITEAGLYTIQIEGRSSGYHVDYLELYKGSNPGNNSADSEFIAANNGPSLAPDVTTLRSNITASTDDFTGLGGAGEDALSFGEDLGQSNTVGLRFDNITIPAGATILEAYLQFEAAEAGDDAANLTIALEDSVDAATYSAASTPDSRDYLADEFVWANVETWDAGEVYQSPDLSALIDEMIAQNGTLDDAALGFLVEGTGSRVANAFDGEGYAPQLVIVFDENDNLL